MTFNRYRQNGRDVFESVLVLFREGFDLWRVSRQDT